jgi:arginase
MEIQPIIVPYDLGRRDVGVGAGPARLYADAVEPLLRGRSQQPEVVMVEPTARRKPEIAMAFDVNRALAKHVRAAADAEKLPVVISGNCNAALGTLGGIGSEGLGVIWLDAHGDFNTPETTRSAVFDGMPLAIAAGLCWQNLAASIGGFQPVAPERILHLGARDDDAPELSNMRASNIEMVSAADFATGELMRALQRLRSRAAKIYLHFDVDVITRDEAHANEYSPPGGVSIAELGEALRLIASTFRLAALGIASYDPAYDPEGRIPAAVELLLRRSLFAR